MKLCQRVPAKLHTHGEQPQGEGQAHGTYRNSRSQAGTDESAQHSADDEVDEQICIQAGAVEMKCSANDGEAQAKGEICSDYAAHVEGSEAEESERSQGSSAGGGESDLCADG